MGRAGDVLSSMAFLKHEADAGKRPVLVTSSPFHELLEGQTGCECLLYPGPAGDVAGATIYAKTLSSDVRVLHVQVTPEEIKTGKFKNIQTDSFEKEMWRLAGHFDLWKENLPLVFDNRSPEREAALMPDKVLTKQPTVLVALGGVSSPFKYRKLLTKLIELRFKKPWTVIDLTKIKAHRLYDLLGLMDRARFLVATDSAVLHLARAVPTLPVVALMNDSPSLWHGSPWRPEHIWTCRYRDFPTRAVSMIEAMDNLYHGGLAYNPTVKRDGPALIHCFSAYEGINEEAKENWKDTYAETQNAASWIHSPVYFGAFGRDSRFAGVGDRLRVPYVKDTIRFAAARCKSDQDTIVLTKSDTCFIAPNGFLSVKSPYFSHRATRDKDGNLTHHPAIDLFAFTKEWWKQHVSEMPDMILGRDYYWQRTLKALLQKHGGVEVPWLTYQAKEQK